MPHSPIRLFLLIFGLLWTISEAAAGLPRSNIPEVTTGPPGGNILLLVADDVGVDKIHAYGEHPKAPMTPNIDALAARGVLFRNAYAPPSCSPARAVMLSGRFGRRMGIGTWILIDKQPYELPVEVLTIPRMLDRYSPLGYDTALAGKWHLASFETSPGLDHPKKLGFRRFAGPAGNLKAASVDDGKPRGYYHWERIADGTPTYTDRYATTVTVDDALTFVKSMAEPWFLMVSFNAAHPPLDLPPASLLGRSTDGLTTAIKKYDAIVEALDAEIGRLLSEIEPATLAKTTVLFVSDGGTLRCATAPPLDSEHAKQTMYEGGINVPLIVAGPHVSEPGSESSALVHVADIFATVADIAGVTPDHLRDPNDDRLILDGQTLLPYLRDPGLPSRREYLYLEYFGANGKPPYHIDERAIRDRRWKLIRRKSEPDELFDLEGRFDDGPNLLERPLDGKAQAAYKRLAAELDRFAGKLTYAGF